MNKLKHRIRSSVSALLSVLMISSVFSVSAALNVSAYTYSDRSALDQYAYSGNDLGANYTKASTTFKVWAPTASDVQIKRYTTGSDSESGAKVIETKPMTQGGQGVWSITISGDLAGTYYTYLIKQKDTGETKETVDKKKTEATTPTRPSMAPCWPLSPRQPAAMRCCACSIKLMRKRRLEMSAR